MNLRAWATSKLVKLLDGGALSNYINSMFGGSSSTGIIVTPQSAMQAAAVYSCIKVLAESIGQLPLGLFTGGGSTGAPKKMVDGDGLLDLLRYQPNDYQTASEFFEMMVAHMELRGNAYAYINRTARGRVVEILPLQPDFVTVQQVDGGIAYRVTNGNGGQTPFGAGEILHLRGLSLNGYLGISPIAYMREPIGLALATERYGAQIFKNGAKMSGILQTKGKLSKEAQVNLKTSFDEASSGDNAHKTIVLEEDTVWKQVSITPEDAQMLDTRKMQRSEIAAIFRVPPHMIGDLEKATFSNIEQQSLEFVQYALMPRLKRIELSLRRCAFTQAQQKMGMFARFGVEELLRGDATARSNYYASGIVNGWLTRNEARDRENLNPIEGLDEPLVPLNMTDASSAEIAEPGVLPAAPGTTAPGPTPGKGIAYESQPEHFNEPSRRTF